MTASARALWKQYGINILELFLALFISTFCAAMYFFHRSGGGVIDGGLLIVLYLFVIVVSIKRIVDKLPMAILMILAPSAPLIMLIFVLALLPVLERLR